MLSVNSMMRIFGGKTRLVLFGIPGGSSSDKSHASVFPARDPSRTETIREGKAPVLFKTSQASWGLRKKRTGTGYPVIRLSRQELNAGVFRGGC